MIQKTMQWTRHPTIPTPDKRRLKALLDSKGAQAVYDVWKAREDAIKLTLDDPLRHGVNLVSWDRIRWALSKYNEVLVLGGNRGAKTTGMAKIFMESITKHMDGHVVLFSQNADTSVKVQQAAIWEFMPKEFKRKTKGIEGYINYSMQNGFTGQSFIFPDTRTRVDFKTYTQFSNNHTILEGFEFGFPNLGNHPENVGIGNDEYLGDSTLINTQRFRLATRDSRLITGFTPIDGYTELIADYLRDAEILETKHAKLLDEPVPVKQYSVNRDAGIVYLHTDENPFGGYDRIAKDLQGRPKEEILTRAYGVPVKSMTTLFPYFNTNVHVTNEMPEISEDTHTVYQIVDPAGARNYLAIWAAVDINGFITILREWPDRDSYGEWALAGDPKWRFGPAAKKLGYDVQAYIDEFLDIESDLGVEVYERIGDSRFFARENENNTDLFESFAVRGMYFIPSSGSDIETGLSGLDEWMRYNPDAEIDDANRPILKIHSSCGNLIQSLINWGHRGKVDEPLKDWIDLLRYLRMINDGYGPDYVSDASMTITRRAEGGY